MIDEKKCYFFGRNKQACDFCIDHSSCSRVHAVLVWHKHLLRPFIVDLGSSTYFFLFTPSVLAIIRQQQFRSSVYSCYFVLGKIL